MFRCMVIDVYAPCLHGLFSLPVVLSKLYKSPPFCGTLLYLREHQLQIIQHHTVWTGFRAPIANNIR